MRATAASPFGTRRTAAALVALLAAAPGWARAAPRIYVVDPARSRVTVHVGKAGLFKFAGHEHEVVAPVAEGRVVADPSALPASSVTLAFRAADLEVTGKGEPAEDVPKVQEAMEGPKALDATRFPRIAFRSTAVEGRAVSDGAYELTVTTELSLHGVTRVVRLPVRVEVSGDSLTAAGRAVIKHTDYGMRPISVAGVVKVKNELEIDYVIAARALEAATAAPGDAAR